MPLLVRVGWIRPQKSASAFWCSAVLLLTAIIGRAFDSIANRCQKEASCTRKDGAWQGATFARVPWHLQ